MRLAERIRRSLEPGRTAATLADPEPSDRRRQLIARLRREVDRIQAHAMPPAPLPTALPGPPRELPGALDPQGQLYRRDFAPRFRFGRAVLERPCAELLAMMERVLALAAGWSSSRHGPLRAEDLLFLDLETTGLSRSAGTVAFLIGTGGWLAPAEAAGAGGFRVEQIFLRDPGDEALALQRLQERLERARVIVTFNGRGFDLPLLRNRSLIARTRLGLDDLPHLDLLPLCRRLFRPRLLDCRLATLERDLLGFAREGDVDGAEAPRIYNAWLRGGEGGELPLVFEHNRLDVALMAPLLHRVTRHLIDPLQWAEDAEELLGCALLHLDHGADGAALAEACLVRGLELGRRPVTRRSLLVSLARHRRRAGRPHDAGVAWEQFRREFPDHSTGWVELAKYHEHVTRDLHRALELAERCPHQQTDELQRRLRRLRRRVRRVVERGNG